MFGCGHMCKLYQRTVTNKGDLNGTTRFLWGGQSNWQCLEERDSGGDLVARYTYATGYIDAVAVLDADFSADADGVSDVENPYTFTGRRWDLESGLMQYRNRYYDPGLGRFVSRAPSCQDFPNLYEYAKARPILASDPHGLTMAPILIGPTDWGNVAMDAGPEPYGLVNKFVRCGNFGRRHRGIVLRQCVMRAKRWTKPAITFFRWRSTIVTGKTVSRLSCPARFGHGQSFRFWLECNVMPADLLLSGVTFSETHCRQASSRPPTEAPAGLSQ